MTTTQISAPRRGRRLLAGLSALTLAAALSGCATFSPMATQIAYNPGDGVAVSLGDVEVRDLIIIGTAQGEPATVSAYVVNRSDDDVTINISSEGNAPASLDVPANSAIQASPVGEEGLTLESLPVQLGANVPLQFQVDGNAPAQVDVPSVSASTPMYSDLAPSGG
ncbi:MAG: hypothetical protein ABR500_02735 [Dermatophilaceae bacterium]|nr:hypothetical protein [Intrasporangiaceae bacterium]